MIYKRMGRTDLNVSRLGFGAMRLPSLPDGNPDPEESVRIIHRAFELGVNYIDTAVMYCNHQSQKVVGQALKGWRDKVILSTKNHYRGADKSEWRKNLEDSLRLLDVDYIDIYNFHGISWNCWEQWVKGENGILSWMKEARDEGVIRHICCSFHDNAENLVKIADLGEFSVITLQYNLLDRSLEEALPELAARDIGVVVMGPVGGGRLGAPSDAIEGMLEDASSTAETALRFVLSNDAVTLALSGMSTMEQVEENCAVASREEPLTADEREKVAATLERFKNLADLYCTGCNYCMPCESGVEIPAVFSAVNQDRVYGLKEAAQNAYNNIVGKASYCIACGKCEPKCPQNIPIRVQLMDAARRFDPAYGTMALTFHVVRRDEDGLQIRARAHNLSDMPGHAEVRILGDDGGVQTDPGALTFDVEEPFFRAQQVITAPCDGALPDTVALRARIEDGRGERVEEARFTVGTCSVVESIEELDAATLTTQPLRIDRPEQALMQRPEVDSPRSVRVWPGCNDDAFYAVAEIGALEAGQPGDPSAWRLDLVLDVRDREDDLGLGFLSETVLLRVAPDGDAAKAHVLRGQADAAAVAVEVASEPDGAARVCVTLPWSAFIPEDALDMHDFSDGEAIGFDFVFTQLDAKGGQISRAAWGANPHIERDGRTGCLILTEA